jgi:RNA polymerase sigma-70 factor (ECF subfamily)
MLSMTDWPAIHADLRQAFARRQLPAHEVDELVQQASERLVRAQARGVSADRLGPYVGRVVRSVWVDHLRRRRPVQPLSGTEVAPADQPPDLSAEVASWLPALIDTLPERDAQILRLVELQGLSQREAAERLGLSPSGARSRVQRGRRKLLAALAACCDVQRDGDRVVSVARCGSGC